MMGCGSMKKEYCTGAVCKLGPDPDMFLLMAICAFTPSDTCGALAGCEPLAARRRRRSSQCCFASCWRRRHRSWASRISFSLNFVLCLKDSYTFAQRALEESEN